MCRSSWNSVNGTLLNGCIVWTLMKPNRFGQYLTKGHVEGCASMYRFMYECVCIWVHVCGHACLCTCLYIQNSPLCPHLIIWSGSAVSIPTMVTVGVWQLWPCVLDDAIMYLCVILASCHSSFLLRASSVNAQLFTVSPPHHLASLIALDLRLVR